MPRPATTGYAKLTQAEESEDSDDDLSYPTGSLQSASAPRYASITQPRSHGSVPEFAEASASPKRPRNRKRHRSNSSGVDIKAINARLAV